MRPEGLVDVVQDVDVDRVVEVRDREELLAPGDPALRQRDRLGLLVDDVVALPDLLDLVELAFGDGRCPRQPGNDPVDLVVEVRGLLGRPRDDERRPRLVDQNRVHLVHDRVVELPLHDLVEGEAHVVAKIVEAELVVGAVRDVGEVRFPARARAQVGQPGVAGGVGGVIQERGLVLDHRDGESEEVIERAHPHRVASREVVVDRHDVDAAARQPVEHGRERGDQGLPLAGRHLGDLALVQDHAPHELHVEVAHGQPPPTRFPHQGEGLDEERLDLGAVLELAAELVRPRPKIGVRAGAEFGLQRVDARDARAETPDVAVVLRTEDLAEYELQHDALHCTAKTNAPGRRLSRGRLDPPRRGS